VTLVVICIETPTKGIEIQRRCDDLRDEDSGMKTNLGEKPYVRAPNLPRDQFLEAVNLRPNSPAGVERNEIHKLSHLLFTSLNQEM